MADIAALIAKLRDPVGRYFDRVDAVRALGKSGLPQALKALGEALGDKEQMVRQEAIKALGASGQAAGVPILVAALEGADDSIKPYAAESLGLLAPVAGDGGAHQAAQALQRAASGGSFMLRNSAERALDKFVSAKAGPDAGVSHSSADSSVSSTPGTAPTQAPSGSHDLESLLKLALEGTRVTLKADRSGRYRITVPLDHGRKQTLFITNTGRDQDGADLLSLYSICGPAAPANHESALKLNARSPYGAMAIAEMEGKSTYIMVHNFLASDTTPTELRKAILSVARQGDKAEKSLTGKDAY